MSSERRFFGRLSCWSGIMTRSRSRIAYLVALLFTAHCSLPTAHSQCERVVIDADLPGGYQVEVADVNGDKKPDVIALGGSTCAWYENPTWKKRIVSTGKQTPGIISSATADIDGDGKAEIAIAYEFEMSRPTQGRLALAIQGRSVDDPWRLIPIDDLGSIHRLRWGDIDGDSKLDLVVAPIFGPRASPPAYEDKALVVAFQPYGNPTTGSWHHPSISVVSHPVIHSIEVRPVPSTNGRSVVLTADNEGVSIVGEGVLTDGQSITLTQRSLVPGASGDGPKRGCSEVHLGRLGKDRHFLATIEPWHGSEVVIWTETEPELLKFGPRTVLDATLADGHALWVADVDGDGDDEVFAGHRGKDHRVSMYDFDRVNKKWVRTVLDRDIAAQDLRGGDLDGDSVPDVVAVGGATHNVVWYRFRRP
jgi:FG-GAP-like repeat